MKELLTLIWNFVHSLSRWSILPWRKYSKKITDLQKANTVIDMKVRNRLDSMIEEIINQDIAVSLDFLIDYLHLAKDKDDAIQELNLYISLIDHNDYGVVIDDSNQSVYIFFKTRGKAEE